MSPVMPVGVGHSGELKLTPGASIHYDFSSISSYPRTGSTVYDVSGQGVNGFIRGNLTYTTKYGGAVSFDGKSSFIEMNSQVPYTGTAGSSYTMGAWISPTTMQGNIVAMAAANPADNWQMPPMFISAKCFKGQIWQNNVLSSTPFTVGTWYYVVLVWNASAGSQTLYVNGSQVATQTGITYSSSGINNYLWLGKAINNAANDQGWFTGYMGNFHYYGNQALTQAQIQQNYNALYNRYVAAIQSDYVSNGLVMYMDTNVSTSYTNGSNTWIDLSVNGLAASGTTAGFAANGGLTAPGGTTNVQNYVASTPPTNILNTDTHTISFAIKFNSTLISPSGTSGNWEKIFGYDPSGSDRSPGIWRFPSNRYIHWRYDPGNTGHNLGPLGSGTPTGTDTNNPSSEFDLDTWFIVTGSKNGSTFSFYVNGVLMSQDSTVLSAVKTAGTSAINILEGYTSGSSVTIDSVMVYNRVLSDAEVLTNYNALAGKYKLSSNTYRKIFEVDASNPASYPGTGTTVTDVSGQNMIGTMQGSIPWSSQYGGYWDFTQGGTGITFPTAPQLDVSTVTLEVWVNPRSSFSSSGQGTYFTKGNAGTEWDLGSATSSILFNADAVSPVAGWQASTPLASTVSTNDWNHVVASYSVGLMKLYVNGQLVSTNTTPTGTNFYSSGGITVGGGLFGPMPGWLGEARAYNRQLSDAEVLYNYNNTKGRYLKANLPLTTTSALYSFPVATSFQFTSAGTVGPTPPSYGTLIGNYNTTTYPWLTNSNFYNVLYFSGYQYWTVPQTGTYQITAVGASGHTYSAAGGYGATSQGTFLLQGGSRVIVAVGQRGDYSSYGGGGGATFVGLLTPSQFSINAQPSQATPLVVGAGGACSSPWRNATDSASGALSTSPTGGTIYQSNGSASGAGWSGNGTAATGCNSSYPLSFTNGGTGSTTCNGGGGFGGGAGTDGCCCGQSGAGGGYQGGNAQNGCGSGAPSTAYNYNSGTSQVNTGASNANNNGYCTIYRVA